MLTVVSGRFHPHLESAFKDRIRDLKKADPLKRIAVVAPSGRLMERLQLILAAEGLALMNLHFHTFASLAEKVVDSEAPLPKPILSDPLFFDTLVKQIVRDDKPFDAFEELAVPDGFPPAVRGTLRDLLDAGINQENVDALVQERFAGKDVDLGSLRSLLNLHRLYLSRLAALDVVPRSELLRRAIDLSPESSTLNGFKEILYYGFYDLTGLQADFFEAVVKNHPSRFFFPYVHGHPAYAFAKDFRDIFLQRVMREEVRIETPVREPALRILNVSGERDEAWFVANEVRRLHDEEGVAFSEIGVIARTKERLGFFIEEALADRRIPFRPSTSPALTAFPAAQQALEFLETNRPEKAVSWKAGAALAEKLLDEQFFAGKELRPELKDEMLKSLRLQSGFDRIGNRVSWEDFIDALRERWSRTALNDPAASEVGVPLLYAEAARGLPFKVVFLIGLEERVFPRIVREDPFLRDEVREALNGIGHKISKKMAAFNEERLLFELFVAAASQRLVLTYQRSDDEGAVVGASPFLRAFAQERGVSLEEPSNSLPRPLLDKLKQVHPNQAGLTDVVIGLLSARREADAVRLAGALGRDGASLERGLLCVKALSRFDGPGPFDGLIGTLTPQEAFRSGTISPTPLETLNKCGFKYFAGKMLRLSPAEADSPEESLAPDLRGRLLHSALRLIYGRLTDNGARRPPAALPVAACEQTFAEAVPENPPEEAKLPPVLWSATRAALRAALLHFLELDFARRKEHGGVPSFFEVAVEGELPPPLHRWRWRGVVDRIDIHGDEAWLIDYKSGRPFDAVSVANLAEKGEKLQSPIYLSLAQRFLEKAGHNVSKVSFRYDFIDFFDDPRVLEADDWAAHSKAIFGTLERLVNAALAGNFVIKTGRHCQTCDVIRACRRYHGISVHRSAQLKEGQS